MIESSIPWSANEGKSARPVHDAQAVEARRMLNVGIPELVQAPYINTISPEQEPEFPGDEVMEKASGGSCVGMRSSWSPVPQALRRDRGPHFHLRLSAALYEVGFTILQSKDDGRSGDQIFFQGHALPASMPAPTSKGASPKRRWTTSAANALRGAGAFFLSAPAPDAGLSGNSPQFRWGSGRSMPLPGPIQPLFTCTRHWRTHRTPASGLSWETASAMEPEALGSLFLRPRKARHLTS